MTRTGRADQPNPPGVGRCADASSFALRARGHGNRPLLPHRHPHRRRRQPPNKSRQPHGRRLPWQCRLSPRTAVPWRWVGKGTEAVSLSSQLHRRTASILTVFSSAENGLKHEWQVDCGELVPKPCLLAGDEPLKIMRN